MEREGSARRAAGSNVKRIFILIACLFAILILGLISATLHYVMQIWNDARDSSTSPPDNTKTSEEFLRSLPLPLRFPGYFHGPEEQIPVPARTIYYHACCISNSFFISPAWMIDINGKNRTLATFQDKKQYFVKEDCIGVKDCSKNCRCQATTAYETAVVYTDNKTDYELAWFRFKRCCKCINVNA